MPEVGYSTYYHANYVSPRWIGDMSKIDRIGRHIFYKKRNEQPYIVEASSAGTTPCLRRRRSRQRQHGQRQSKPKSRHGAE